MIQINIGTRVLVYRGRSVYGGEKLVYRQAKGKPSLAWETSSSRVNLDSQACHAREL